MRNELLAIIKHYGLDNQLKYIHSEYFELDEAIICCEESGNNSDYYKNHIAEEIADVMVMLKQFQYYYDINDEDIEKVMQYKIERQLERINNE